MNDWENVVFTKKKKIIMVTKYNTKKGNIFSFQRISNIVNFVEKFQLKTQKEEKTIERKKQKRFQTELKKN